MALILAIESSCDETAVAIIKDGELLSNIVSTQIDVHRKYGGVMPEIASRLHAENISIVLKEAIDTANIKLEDVDAFAVTRGPGLIGALHVGLQAAKTLAMEFGNLDNLASATMEELLNVSDIGETTAANILAWFSDPQSKILIENDYILIRGHNIKTNECYTFRVF